MIATRSTSSADTAALWAEYGRTRTLKLRNLLAEQYMDTVSMLAEKLGRRLPYEVERDDLIQWGAEGLMQAVAAFDPARGLKFSTFATRRIVGAMLDGLRDVARCRRGPMTAVKNVGMAEEELAAQLDRPPTAQEVMKRAGMTSKQFRRAQQARAMMMPVSLSRQTRSNSNNRLTEEIDGIADAKSSDPAALAQISDGVSVVIKMLLGEFRLTEVFVIRLYYLEEMTLRRIGEILALSECRISQIRMSVMGYLQREFRKSRG